ncbi:hypothetical protein [Accumulibacter sp.]|uniref:hypothetical protein n=1 Tax=Accumulibacter sp. TaxID=2053492 RepID=UPI001AD3FDDD|nr:hypothetical protein [Accumulibacter sp.]MBN8515093.1 hypothetical protein [Accumulibacter sp.]MBO3703026.1 hypothetical protein [Accumulibacter sp.]
MSAVLSTAPATMKISDLQTGFRILSRLPLANSRQAQFEINNFLDSLLQSPPPGDVYLQLLEQTRISLCFIEEQLAREYTSKALPLGDAEEAAFQQVVATWLKASRAYAHCARLQRTDDEDDDAADRLALILHRCIYYTGMAISEYHRARRQLPRGMWLNLHGFYASAEEWGVATLAVPDSLDPLGRSTHCTAAFASQLLTELAGPYSLSVQQLGVVRRWASNWAPLLTVHPVAPGESLPPTVVDLMEDAGLRPAAACLQTENIRRIDSARLAMQINQTRRQLQQKITPSQLGLGEDCSASQCQQLLQRLARPWSLLRAARQFRRHPGAGMARVCAGFTGVHYIISGKEFSQPESARIYSREEFDSLFTFRYTLDPTQQLEVRQTQLGFAVDDWEVLDESANGFRLLRSTAGRRLVPEQLLSICPHDGNAHLLAQVVWLMQEQGGGLIAGISALPGRPQAVAARPLAREAGRPEPYSRAFMLPAVAAIGAQQSLVIPQGWFYSGRLLEIYVNGVWRVKLDRVIGSGADFDRVSFSVT